jgi:hypothetical protein
MSDFNPNHYRFPRVSNHREPGWLYVPPDTWDRLVFVAVMVMGACALIFLGA